MILSRRDKTGTFAPMTPEATAGGHPRTWPTALARYHRPSTTRSILEILVTAIPFVATIKRVLVEGAVIGVVLCERRQDDPGIPAHAALQHNIWRWDRFQGQQHCLPFR